MPGLQTALEIQRTVTRDRFAGINLDTRIGINSGNVFAGNVGTGERKNYTVHGDAVNLAARLERLNKDYGTQLLVSADTVRQTAPPRVSAELVSREESARSARAAGRS